MHKVDIKIFCIAQTRLNPDATRQWLDHVEASEYPVPNVDGYIEGNQLGYIDAEGPEVSHAGAVCGLCAKRCYMSFEPGLNPNVTRVRKNWFDYLTNVIKSGHGSVTEHASWTFAIEGISRVFTGELNRHRAGVAISEGSMRYIRFDDIGFWMPISLQKGNQMLMPTSKCKACKGSGEGPTCTEHFGQEPVGTQCDLLHYAHDCPECGGRGRKNLLTEEDFEGRKANTRQFFESAFREMEHNYRELCAVWEIESMKSFNTKKKLTSLFRRIIGMGVATGGTWTFNTRALRHIVALRTSPHAEEEIAYVIGEIGKHMVETEPALFGDFTRDEKTGAWIPEHYKV